MYKFKPDRNPSQIDASQRWASILEPDPGAMDLRGESVDVIRKSAILGYTFPYCRGHPLDNHYKCKLVITN